MAKIDKLNKNDRTVSDATLRKSADFQRIGNRAVHRAQQESRRLGIPNWYSINGRIISDQDEQTRKEE